MSADKRSVSTDALETLGLIHTRDEHRDAIHLGVEPVTAGEELEPGQDIGFGFDGRVYLTQGTTLKPVGIVDPFLKTTVQRDQKFWLVVYPRQITSLRHVWTHPDFPDNPGELLESNEAVKLRELLDHGYMESKRWVENYLEQLNNLIDDEDGSPLSLDELLETADSISNGHWDYIVRGGAFEGHSVDPRFWDHFEVLKQRKVPNDKRENFLSCSC